MTSDWIKMRTDLYRDPRVIIIAEYLMDPDGALARHVSQNCHRDMCVTRSVTRHVTVGALTTVWGVLRHRGKRNDADLFIKYCTIHVIDDVADLPGFGDAMAQVGWVRETEEGIVFPNFFSDFNIDPAEKKREQDKLRQRKYREKKCHSDSHSDSHVTVTHREEKRREEKKNGSSKDKPAAKTEYPEWFERIWQIKPKRDGSDPKRSAYRAACARINEDADEYELAAGLRRYVTYLQSKGMAGTSTQMQMQRFFGPNKEFREDWKIPKTGGIPPGARIS